MDNLLRSNNLILLEAAVVERLRRADSVSLHPTLLNAPLIYQEEAGSELRRIYGEYMEIALAAGLPFLMCTPTWRANRELVERSGVRSCINGDAVRFIQGLRNAQGDDHGRIRIGGMIGCKNDCYQPAEALSAVEAERFHAWQIDELAQAGADFLIAETLPCISEARGIARAMAKTGLAYLISFVIDRRGRLLDGTPLVDAVEMVDAAADCPPTGYMVNCSYPSFLCADTQPTALFERLIGYQANASSLDHCDLDGSECLEMESVAEWGDEMLTLNTTYGVKILGGCCGTGAEHLQYIVDHRKSRLGSDL